MREITIDNKKVRVRATPLALLFYRQEFKADLLGDLMKLERMKNDPSQFDAVTMLQLIWAMAKADALGREFPSFVEWVGSLESIDFADPSLLLAALEEAADGFFRTGAKAGAKTNSRRR